VPVHKKRKARVRGGCGGILHSVFSKRETSKSRATHVECWCREVREEAKTEAGIT